MCRKIILVIGVIFVAVIFFINCNETGEDHSSISSIPILVGSDACAGCHKDIVESHLHTAHFNTTSPASIETIKGSFNKDENSYRFSKRSVVKCEEINGEFYQVAYVDGVEKMRQKFDIVFGDGINAQSFASWSKDKLVQLPVSYLSTAERWINSPGYPDKIVFNRVITSRCLECHTTYAKVISREGVLENFSRSNLVLGIDCEKCHGAASNHVKYHRENPADSAGKFIVSTKGFTRQQKLDMCALCHSGIMINKQPAFSFTPGDRLSDYYAYNTIAADIESLDVHGNQYGLLTLSQCFLQSDLTCNSCHDSHKKETGDILLFSERCMSCHKEEHKKIQGVTGVSLQENCIDCHMPEKESKTIVFHDYSTKERLAAGMRTHLIKIYPEQTEKIIRYLKQKK